jgi:hypothetical protein
MSSHSLVSNIARLEQSDSKKAREQPVKPWQQPAKTDEERTDRNTASRIANKNLFFSINPPLYRSLKQQKNAIPGCCWITAVI